MKNFLNDQEGEVNKIIDSYEKIAEFFLKFGLYCVVFVFSFVYILFAEFWNSNKILQAKEYDGFSKIWIQKTSDWYKGDMIYTREKPMAFSWFDIKLLNWEIKEVEEKLVSQNNIVFYKWFVLPKVFDIKKRVLQNIKEISYFDKSDYDIKFLEGFMQEVVFSKVDKKYKNKKNNIRKIKKSLNSEFGLSCVWSKILFVKNFCQRNIDNFISQLPYYNIADYSSEYSDKFDLLSKKWYKKELCEATVKNMFFSYTFSQEINDKILSKCWDKYTEFFKNLVEFDSFKQNIENWLATKKKYSWKSLNKYKLLSLQQNIYNQIEKGNVDFSFVSTYLDFVSQLMKDLDLKNFYIDLIYLYNNKFLKEEFDYMKVNSSYSRSDEIEKVIKKIKEINNWTNPLLLWKKLKESVSNTKLISYVWHSDKTKVWSSSNYRSFGDIFDNFIWNFTNVVLLDKNIDKEKRTVLAKLHLKFEEDEENNGETKELQGQFGFSINWSVFEVYNIRFPDEYWDLQNIVRKQINKGVTDFRDIKLLIRDNIFLSSSWKYDFCKHFQERFKEKQSWIKKWTKVKVLKCDDNSLIVRKNSINYKFSFANNSLKKISISDKQLQDRFSWITDSLILKENSIDKILSVVFYKKSELKSWEDIKISILSSILNRLDKFLNIKEPIVRKPKGLKEKEYQIYFDIDWKQFGGIIDISNYKLSKLKFIFREKDWKIEKEIPIDGLNFYLMNEDKGKLNQFQLNVLDYVEKINPEVYEEYKVYKEKNK